jgi:hypothetical protein
VKVLTKGRHRGKIVVYYFLGAKNESIEKGIAWHIVRGLRMRDDDWVGWV